MKENLTFKIIDFSNIKEAIKVQNDIFPNENGTVNLLGSIDRELFMKITGLYYIDDNVKYYLAYTGDIVVGIIGLYSYKDKYPNDAWIGWFGVINKYRNRGYGTNILECIIKKAKSMGFENLRLYTDLDSNKEAVKLYEKCGFAGEKYSAECLDYNCYIFSKNINNKSHYMWNNKMLGLSYQSELQNLSEDELNCIIEKYEIYFNET